jgi:hypothetical protein
MLARVTRLVSTLAPVVAPAVALVVALVVTATSGCFLAEGDPCCRSTLECAPGARCFEGTCALSCDDSAQCAEGEVCVEGAGVCRATNRDRELARCPYEPDEARR